MKGNLKKIEVDDVVILMGKKCTVISELYVGENQWTIVLDDKEGTKVSIEIIFEKILDFWVEQTKNLLLLRVPIEDYSSDIMDPYSSNVIKRFIWIDIVDQGINKCIPKIIKKLKCQENSHSFSVENFKKMLTSPFLFRGASYSMIIEWLVRNDEVMNDDIEEELLIENDEELMNDDIGEEILIENDEESKFKPSFPIIQEDIDRCKKKWLNDSIVDCFFEYMEKKYKLKKFHILLTSFYNILNKKDFKRAARNPKTSLWSREYLVFPICQGNHWILVLVKLDPMTICIFDSMGHTTQVRKITESVRKYLEARWCREKKIRKIITTKNCKYIKIKSPKQKNSVDCGVFVCLALEYLLTKNNVQDYFKDWVDENVPLKVVEMRKRLRRIIETPST